MAFYVPLLEYPQPRRFERPECEIESARSELRSEAEQLFPDKAQLYEIIYESRFCRLWEQFRKQGGDSR